MYTELIRSSILGCSTYAVYLSGTAALQLNTYLSASQKAARVSNKASDELTQTQSSVSFAVLSSLFSLVSVVYVHLKNDGWTSWISLFNTIVVLVGYKAVQSYWGIQGPGKMVGKVAGDSDYVDAWSKMRRVQQVLVVTGGLWTLATMTAGPNALFK